MFYYSGHDINDLENYNKCNDIHQAKYILIQLVKSPGVFIGFCGPEVCTT
jgi:hypothetical protein